MTSTNRPATVLILGFALTASLVVAATSANAAVVVYEGFQYDAVNDSLEGQPDGGTDIDATGLTGVWDDTLDNGDNLFLKSGSLGFGDLSTNGNHVGFDSNTNNDIFTRGLSAGAQGVTAAVDEIWFSILAEKLQNNFSAAEGGFVLANQTVGNSRILENDGTDGLAGFGVAPTTSGDDWTAYAWDGSSQSAGDAALTVGVGSGDIRLLVGHISYDTGAGGTDEYTLFEYLLNGGSVEGGTLNQIASTLEVNVDQSLLDTVNLTRQVNTNFDELRIATTLEEALGLPAPIPEPSTALLLAVGVVGFATRCRRRRHAD